MKIFLLIALLFTGCKVERPHVVVKHDTVWFYNYDTIETIRTKRITRNIIDSQWIRFYALAASDLARLAESKDVIIGMQSARVNEYQEQNKILGDSLKRRHDNR